MLIDLKLTNKTVLIFGGGSIGERKARKILQANSKIIVLSKDFSSGLKKINQHKNIKLIKIDLEKEFPLTIPMIKKSDIIIAAIDDSKINKRISSEARKAGVPVNVVDDPSISDFFLPAITRAGRINVAVSTEGGSPAMARILCEKIEKNITSEEILQVELQTHARRLLKHQDLDGATRRDLLYQIIQDSKIKNLLKEENLEEAKNIVDKIIEGH